MLETLVSSKIRRALLEYVLTHPKDSFYLRGLAKELQLSVSPLRRELKRLEHAGMLKAAQEGNMLFYTLNEQSPAFQRLQQEVRQLAPRSAAEQTLRDSAPMAAPIIARGAAPSSGRPLSSAMLITVSAVGLAAVLGAVGLFYAGMINQRSFVQTIRELTMGAAGATSPAATPMTSGLMHSSRWRVAPGGMGGLGAGNPGEAY